MATKKVLVVEDERPLARALQLKLSHEGMDVTIAVNGEEGLKLIQTGEFDVVLLDMMMPVMGGFAVLEAVKDMPNKPTIFVSSNLSVHDDADKVLAMGAEKFFIKSDTPLSEIVEEVKKA